jgi:hypothetical protein
MEINTLIISKNLNNNELVIEFVIDKTALNTIISNRYNNTPYYILTTDKLPALFLEFSCCFDIENWSDIDPKFVVGNFEKAKEIQRDKWRKERTAILEKLDVEYMRADELNNTSLKQQIASQKQALRDVTEITLPDDLESIKNTWPAILNV